MKNKITLKKVKRWHKTSKLDKLINMSYDELKSLKNREVISLYIADSYTKTGHSKKAAYFVNKALKWGCPKKLVLKILVSHVDETPEKLNSLKENTEVSLAYLNSLTQTQKIELIVAMCFKEKDILESLDNYLLDDELNDDEKFSLCCLAAQKMVKEVDRHQGINLINNARLFFSKEDEKRVKQYQQLIEFTAKIEHLDLSIDLYMNSLALKHNYSDEVNKKILEGYDKIRAVGKKKQQHGHDLLIDYIEKNIKDGEGKERVLTEIGTTRENIPGQGATMQLAKLAKKKNLKSITVDMDIHNSRWAEFVGKRLGLEITTVTKKGEDFLRDDIEEFDFIFLDAYDFDHGMHSELSQTRYEKFLGSKIDEEECHLMHLDCAKSVVEKLNENGVVCVDDTWLDENWTAKGTLAVPYLFSIGFKIIENRNNVVLLRDVR